ncbi:monocarboxylate transporter 12-like [Patiria miniata]|uniref:Major facilitator superfamily (MFS) profile domain-containing protein n=1 Tax=Patiria miniata TaxID=46514 RepID=A0A914A6V2_PATMI|nr:monocarboxylate transporter 12-like [Patiria miniata]
MMLGEIQYEFSSATWVLGTIFALVECVSDLLAPIAGPLGRRLGTRSVVMVGGVMVTAGLIIASQASSIVQIALSMNILLAIGYCVVNVLTRAALGQHFDNKMFALASGIAYTGNSLSLVTQPPLMQLFIDTYGWRGAMLLLSSICFHLVVCGALLVPLPTGSGAISTTTYTPLEQSTDQTNDQMDEDKRGTRSCLKSFCQSLGESFGISLIKDYNFWIITFIFVVNRVNKGAWLIYFVPHAVSRGIANNVAATMVTAAGLGYLATSLLVSLAVFKELVSSTSAMLVSIVVVSASFLIEPWMTSGWMMSANACVYMAGMGTVFGLGDVMVKEFIGFERMANAFGWMGFISGLFRFFSGFVPGWIYDHSGSYDAAFVGLGAVQLVTAFPLLWMCLRNSRCSKPRP